MGSNNITIFDDYQYADCNNCESYWNNQCDAVRVGSIRNCNSYKAVRSMDIPKKVCNIDSRLNALTLSCACMGVGFLIHIIGHIL